MMKQVKFRIPLRMMAVLFGLVLSIGAYAQITVNGHVKDATGEPIIGATVRVAGSEGGTVTDFDGNFQIKAPQGATLNVTYIGYQPANVKAAANVVVTLQDDAKVLENVVVIGYGRAKKNDLTGSVTAIKPDDMNKGVQVSAQDMITGKIAGVNVQNNGGEPGGGASIRIRGGSSLSASNEPLIVIDGLAMDNYGMQGASNALNLVNPNDIESFTVLKDASATAIYGSRASNGVIIITTKKGRKNMKPTISYNGNVSVSAVAKKVDVMNAAEFMDYIKTNSGMTDEEWQASDYYKNMGYWSKYNADGTPADGAQHLFADTDWQDQIYRTAVSTDQNVTLTGAYKNLPYRVSLGYTKQQGVLKTSDYERYTASVSLNPTFFDDHLAVNFNAKGMYSKTSYASTSAIGSAVSMDPTKPVYMNDDFYKQNFGGYFQYHSVVDRGDTAWGFSPNSLATRNPMHYLNEASDKGKGKELTGNIELDYKIHGFEDLHIHMNAGMDLKSGKSNKEYSRYYYDNYYYGSQGWNTQDTYNLSLNLYAQYLKDFAEIHHIDVMGGYEWQHFNKETDYYYYGTYPSTSIEHAGEIYNPSENTLYKTENYLVSFFGRLNYSLLDRYLFTFTIRDDGSSRFHKDQRWGVFPSAALAWKIKEEPFLRDAKAISDMKLRLGWGKTGQQEGIGDYSYFASYTTNGIGAYYPIVGDGLTYRPDAYNAALTWEKTTTYNAGLDLGFANDRFTASIDYYYRKTTDLINTVTVAAGSNFRNKVTSNVGELHNQGLEFSLTYRPIVTKDWRWEVGYNFTYNDNKIDKLVASDDPNYKILHGGLAVGDSGSDGIQAWAVGHPVSAYYTYQQVYDQNGLPIEGEFVDRNGDGIINSNDRYFYKKADADVLMGFTSKLIYKKWDFSFSLRASLGNYAYNAVDAGNSNVEVERLYNGRSWHNVPTMVLEKKWNYVSTEDGLSDYFIQNASFLKCDNITVGYSFEKLFKLPISGRIYATAQNVFTITKYKGIDPEINGGYDGNIYPRPFTGVLGLNLNF
ncbi:TonB-dependent receptor [Prevotella sp. P2-180]|uniref:SusC/RagA family TonB-linked outer membrane protein n=1 Tax=Prevotella sp. P2-180 TaxID=2024224 RepID=UPI000B9674A7|nr:TonB-dependent receptor [Prevotella sp. P2-180]OYP69095.1 SusC/RagA family protein [Prevotella sp. P2-180]